MVWLGLVALVVAPVVALVCLYRLLTLDLDKLPAPVRAVGRGVHRLVHGKQPPRAQCRPIELIAGELRRLGGQFRNAPVGRSYARSEGVRRAYDGVLVEGCHALEIETTLDSMSAGEDRDLERLRVEHLLGQAGLRADDAA